MIQKPSITINKKTLVLLSSLFLILTGGLITYATPPVSPYTVGETLDPICNPGDPFCFVDIPTGLLTANNGLTASGTNVQLGGTLVKDTDIIQGTNTITSTFTGVTGTYTFLNGNYGPMQGTGMLYTPTATPHIVTAAVVGNTGAALATKNYITTESSDVSAWIDLGTGEHRAAISARASDVSSVYAFTSFAHGTAIMSEYNKVLDFTSKMI